MKFLENNKTLLDILWICLMAIMCFIDIYMLCLGWNVLSLIGLILCGISLVSTLFKVFGNKFSEDKNMNNF